MRYETLILDGDVPEWQKFQLACDLIIPSEQHIPYSRKTLEFLSWFHNCGRIDISNSNNAETGDNCMLESRMPYRFDVDYPYIYAAFLELYGLDLESIDYLHWWDFSALFRSLHDCKFTEIVGYRMTDTTDMSERMKSHYIDMQERYELPISKTTKIKIAHAQGFLNG